MKVLIIDNYDSFTYNLVHLIQGLDVQFEVWRNDQINFEAVCEFDKILLSPGPGLPHEAGQMPMLIEQYAHSKPMLGVCLGCQALAVYFGAELYNLKHVKHGVQSPINILDKRGLYYGFSDEIQVGRYHSWAINITQVDKLRLTAQDSDAIVMSFRHETLPIYGIQYHPESIMTKEGRKLLKNWLFE